MNQKTILYNYMQERLKAISFIMHGALTNATKIYGMKPSLIILFLTIMLLCAMLLRAAGNNKRPFTIKNITQQTTGIETQKEVQLVPNAIIL